MRSSLDLANPTRPQLQAAIALPCPTCNASPGIACHTGTVRLIAHRDRYPDSVSQLACLALDGTVQPPGRSPFHHLAQRNAAGGPMVCRWCGHTEADLRRRAELLGVL